MTSIASMSKSPPPPPSKESLILKAAFEAAGIKQAALARQMDVSPGMVWQWLNGATPVAAQHAVKLGELLSVQPKRISAAYAAIAKSEPGNVVPLRQGSDTSDPRRPDQVIARLENDAHAANLALAVLVSVMTRHRPAEARDAAAALRKTVPAKFRDRGLIHELLATLDKA
jgi:transcriptional regulator with XRE-family HTH domain